MSTDLQCWHVAVAIGVVALALVTCPLLAIIFARSRIVHERLPVDAAMDKLVVPWTLKGIYLTSAVLYHLESNTMIVVAKSVVPPQPWTEVALRVTCVRLPEARRYHPERGRRFLTTRDPNLPYVLPYVIRKVPRRYLPLPREGEVLSDVPCGASLLKARTAVAELIAACPSIGTDARFYVWSVGQYSFEATFGRFDDA
jgi:hypothetical protein